ncbi:hypothetical protein B484DRAFT_36500, partial [Ochromonadaceae sp. CCMP2298]
DTTEDLSLDDLPPLLAYHLCFLEVLSGCTVGRLNITTVEAKVQSVYSNVDIVASILDPGTILVAKIIMSKFLFNAVIEVELVIPGLERGLHLWRLLASYESIITSAKDDIIKAQTLGWEGASVCRQRIEYVLVSIMIIGGFFAHYYDATLFRGTDKAKGSGGSGDKGKMRYTKSDANQLIVSFFHRIKDIYDLDSPILQEEMKVMMRDTLETLKKHGAKYIHVHIAPRPVIVKPLSISPPSTSTPTKKSGKPAAPFTPTLDVTTPGSPGEESPSRRLAAKKAKEDAEQRLISKYRDFLSILNAEAEIQEKAMNENVAFISILERLPFIADPVEGDVRYETLIRKL